MNVAYSSVLLVERDPSTKQALERALQREGLETLWARNSKEAETILATRQPCLIIVNPRLAPEDGWSVCRQLRRSQLPIMLLVPSADPAFRRVALALGVDDCVVSQNGLEEVATRARFVLQRYYNRPKSGSTALTFGNISLDPTHLTATVDGRTVSLTHSEYTVLAALVEGQGRVVPREQLVIRARTRADAFPLARSIDAHVRALRRKLGDDPRYPRILLNVRGVGYRLSAPPPASPISLAAAAFHALADPALVLDDHLRVKLLNQAAEELVGRPAEDVVDHMSCSALFGCLADGNVRGPCPAVAALEGYPAPRGEMVINSRDQSLEVEETIIRLPGEPAHLLLHLRERRHD